MPTLKTRLQAFLNPDTIKSYDNGNLFDNSYGYAGVDYPSGDIRDNDFGYAQAYLSVISVRQAVDYYAMSAQRIPTKIVKNTGHDSSNDEIVATSDDIRSQHYFYEALHDHRAGYGIDPISAMIYNMVLYDTIFVEKVRNQARVGTGLKVLNSLGVILNEYAGHIQSYSYSWNGEMGSTLAPDDMAYTHGFNPFHDLHGAGLLQSAMSKVQIESNLDRFLQSFFRNNATLGLVGSPSKDTTSGLSGTLNEEQRQTLKKIINDWHKGVKNSFRPLILNTPVDFEILPSPDVDKQYDVSNSINRVILTAFGVNPALVGYTDNTNYKEDLPRIEAQFINSRLKPILRVIEDLINSELLPFLTRSQDYRFSFDYSSYQLITEQDTIALDMNTIQLNNGTLSINDYRESNELEPIDELEDMFFIEGIPIPVDEIPNLWKYKFLVAPSVYNSELITDEPLPQPTNPDDVIPTDTGGGAVGDDTDTSQPDDTKSHDHHALPNDLTYEDYNKQFYQPLPTMDDIKSELVNWKKYIKSGKHLKSAFNPIHTRGSVADSILKSDDSEAKLAEIDSQLTALRAQKAIQATRVDCELAVEDHIADSRSKKITKRQFKTRMMQAIRAYGNLAFIDGLKEGGVEGEPDEEDSAFIESHIVKQRQFVNNLADKIYEESKAITDLDATGKPAMWYNKSINPLFEAGKASANRNAMMEWVFGDTDHCVDCRNLNGQRHRMKTYFSKGIIPKSDKLECNGFNCACTLIRVDARARGRMPNL